MNKSPKFSIDYELSKMQMKAILGGDGGYGGYDGEKKCIQSACSFTTRDPKDPTKMATYLGDCAVDVQGGPGGVGAYVKFVCYCKTEVSGPSTPVGSNGGETRCLA